MSFTETLWFMQMWMTVLASPVRMEAPVEILMAISPANVPHPMWESTAICVSRTLPVHTSTVNCFSLFFFHIFGFAFGDFIQHTMATSLLWMWSSHCLSICLSHSKPVCLLSALISANVWLCFPGCISLLGMEGGGIAEAHISASSVYYGILGLQRWGPELARLNNKGLVNAWTSATHDKNPWIEVNKSVWFTG